MTQPMSLDEIFTATGRLKSAVSKSIFGQEELIDRILCCLFSGGHVLMTGAPGLAKTTLVRVISKNLGLSAGRIQFTPDLLPSDIIGSDILNIDSVSNKRIFEFSHGPVFTNLLLADEINRASPRTQSALLEAMQERTCTVGGHRHVLPSPFMVFATQNPFESEGTFPLPEAQLDRFLAHILVTYPSQEMELKILQEHLSDRLVGESRDDVEEQSLLNQNMVCQIIEKTSQIHMDSKLVEAIVELVRATRPEDPSCPEDLRNKLWYGAGPRAGISLISMSRAYALITGQQDVRWHHVQSMAKIVLCHRIRVTIHAKRDQITEEKIVDSILERIEERYKFLARGVAL